MNHWPTHAFILNYDYSRKKTVYIQQKQQKRLKAECGAGCSQLPQRVLIVKEKYALWAGLITWLTGLFTDSPVRTKKPFNTRLL